MLLLANSDNNITIKNSTTSSISGFLMSIPNEGSIRGKYKVMHLTPSHKMCLRAVTFVLGVTIGRRGAVDSGDEDTVSRDTCDYSVVSVGSVVAGVTAPDFNVTSSPLDCGL